MVYGIPDTGHAPVTAKGKVNNASIISSAKEQFERVANWDAYVDARDILPKVEQASLEFDVYIDARDIELN